MKREYTIYDYMSVNRSRVCTPDDQTLAADARLTQRLVHAAAVVVRRAPVHLHPSELLRRSS